MALYWGPALWVVWASYTLYWGLLRVLSTRTRAQYSEYYGPVLGPSTVSMMGLLLTVQGAATCAE